MSFTKTNFFYFSLFYLFTLGIFAVLIYFFGKYYYFWVFLFLGHYVITFIMITYFQLTKSWFLDYKLFWCWLLVLFPYFGLFCFLLYGKGYRLKRPLHLWRKKIKIFHFEKAFQYNQKLLAHQKLPDLTNNIFSFLNKLSTHPIYYNTQFQLIYSTYQKIKLLQKSIMVAKNYILINYCFFKSGLCLDWLTNLLVKKLQKGIKIYLMFDFFDNDFFNPNLKKLIKAGVNIADGGKRIRPNNELFYVNHRKMIVVDGKTAYVGSFNVNDNNSNFAHFGHWIDFCMEITGSAIQSVENIFLKDWLYLTDETLSLPKRKSLKSLTSEQSISNLCQFIDENPRVKTSVTKDTFCHLFTQAKKSIYISTPYLFIDDIVTNALTSAALSGVEVVIFLPQFSTPKLSVDFNRLSYDKLLKSGVKIYEFINAFIHAKLIIIDDKIVSVGSANLDYRSFYFSSETTIILYDQKLVKELKKQFFLENLPYFQPIYINPLRKKNKFYLWFLQFCQIAKVFY